MSILARNPQYVQVVVLYKYPKSSQTDFRKDIHHHLRPIIDLNVRLVILGDFNIQIDCVNTEFVKFMETSFRCRQQIKQSTTDSGSILDLIFSNCEAFCDVVDAYWTDHKLVYCAIDQYVFRCRKLSQSPNTGESLC